MSRIWTEIKSNGGHGNFPNFMKTLATTTSLEVEDNQTRLPEMFSVYIITCQKWHVSTICAVLGVFLFVYFSY